MRRRPSQRAAHGSEQETEASLGDYREVNGVMFPFAIENGIKGSPQKEKITIEKLEINVPLDEASFKMPAVAPAPAAKPDTAKPADKKPPTN